jgi:PAS domain S-box-containing protein
MDATESRVREDGFAVERVAHVYRQQPAVLASSVLGVFLVFVYLFEVIAADSLKAWATYMLTALVLRAWFWHAHRSAAPTASDARRWEYSAALGALLSGVGWGALVGPLFPASHHGGGDFVMLMMVAIAFSAAAYHSLSLLTFLCALLPVMVPLGLRFAHDTRNPLDGSVLAVLVLLGVVLMVQRSQYASIMEALRRRVESELLLAEQQAIFQSASQGIAVVRNRQILKCNQRLGEMLGRRLQDLYTLGFAEHFVDPAEFERAVGESREAFQRGRSYHGVVRLRRANGSEFWAELNGRRMQGEDDSRSVWLIGDVTPTQGAARR